MWTSLPPTIQFCLISNYGNLKLSVNNALLEAVLKTKYFPGQNDGWFFLSTLQYYYQ